MKAAWIVDGRIKSPNSWEKTLLDAAMGRGPDSPLFGPVFATAARPSAVKALRDAMPGLDLRILRLPGFLLRLGSVGRRFHADRLFAEIERTAGEEGLDSFVWLAGFVPYNTAVMDAGDGYKKGVRMENGFSFIIPPRLEAVNPNGKRDGNSDETWVVDPPDRDAVIEDYLSARRKGGPERLVLYSRDAARIRGAIERAGIGDITVDGPGGLLAARERLEALGMRAVAEFAAADLAALLSGNLP